MIVFYIKRDGLRDCHVLVNGELHTIDIRLLPMTEHNSPKRLDPMPASKRVNWKWMPVWILCRLF